MGRRAILLSGLAFWAAFCGASAMAEPTTGAPRAAVAAASARLAGAALAPPSWAREARPGHARRPELRGDRTRRLRPGVGAGLARAAPATAEDGSVDAFYAARGFAPIWLSGGAWISGREDGPAEAALAALATAPAHALPVARYQADDLADELAAVRASAQADIATAGAPRVATWERAARLERALSEAVAAFAADLTAGAVAPWRTHKDVDLRPERPSALDTLTEAAIGADRGDLAARVARAAPQDREYAALRAAYARFSALARLEAATGAPFAAPMPDAPRVLRPGDAGPAVRALWLRLVAFGDAAAARAPSVRAEDGAPVYDADLEAAVRAFQTRHGLGVDGLIGPQTRRALNVSAAVVAQRLAVALERRRWRAETTAPRRVEVNIPAFEAVLFEADRPVFRTRTVVGAAKDRQTPEFAATLDHFVVHPRWYVPRSIAVGEILPKVQADPEFVASRNYKVRDASGAEIDPSGVDWTALTEETFAYRFEQGSGPGNALGRVKFMFPNRHAVYMHDTPAKALFSHRERAFSHGCVRLADPDGFAEALLTAQEADPAKRYARLLAGNRERAVRLDAPVPVRIVYHTLWIDADGVVQSRDDVYGRDRGVWRALSKAGVVVDS